LLRDRLVDRLAWFRAPRLIGGDGIPAVVAFGLERLAEAPGFERSGLTEAGEDVLETYHRAP
jgi:diaminohydroxyphosphoribosylaminopyrimidine deaminase / 5-amino-6-(5-phosphoribosylamino)uracil reductase